MARAYRSTMGTRLRRLRRAHRMSLRALAAAAGTSAAYLSQVESGKRALDRHSAIIALADALGTSPEVITALPVPAPGNGGIDSATEAIRQALLAVSLHRPGGRMADADVLRSRVDETVRGHRRGDRPGEVGRAIAELIRDLHSATESGSGGQELRELAAGFHARATLGWLRLAGAPVDLRLQAATLARRAAKAAGTTGALGQAACGGMSALLDAGLADLARAELDAIDVPATSPDSARLAGMLALCRGLLAAVDARPADAAELFGEAGQLAERTGEGDTFGMGFGPTAVGLWRMYGLLDAGGYAEAARIGADLRPLDRLTPLGQAGYWITYARALARLRGRRDDAVAALLRTEELCPPRLYRDPFARDLIVELLTRSPGGTALRELTSLARRADLPGDVATAT